MRLKKDKKMIDKLIFQELTDAEAANLTGGMLSSSIIITNVTQEPAEPAEPGEIAEPAELEGTGLVTIGNVQQTIEFSIGG